MIKYELLEGKVLADRENRKIGVIVKVRNILPASAFAQTIEPSIIIKVERLLRKELIVEVPAEVVNKIEGYYAWTLLSKEEFLDLIKYKPKLNKNYQPKVKIDLAQ